ncbi:hypothetical protein V2J09_010958 [Rumex salicifolius]
MAAFVIHEQKKLEPMKAERKARWRKEVEWLLSVTDHIVQLVPSQQQSPDGTIMEVMVARQRADLLDNIPALRKLDAMLMESLESFGGENEFWYVDLDDADAAEKNSQTDWCIPVVKLPANGLSKISRQWLLHQKEAVNQVLKAAITINAAILSEMEIPESYIETLPKNGKASLGDIMYKSITDEHFKPEQLLGSMDLSTEHKVVELKNRIEASIVIWKRKMVHKDGKSSWGSIVSLEKRELFEERAETLLLILKHYFPGTPQSSLNISKIENNQDVGRAVLEGYSRVLESFATAVMCRIDEVLDADSVYRNMSSGSSKNMRVERTSFEEPAGAVTLLDFMGWSVDQGDDQNKVKPGDFDGDNAEVNEKVMSKTPPPEARRMSYLERLEVLGGIRSPRARH